MSSYTATELAIISELSAKGMKDDQIAQEIGRSRTGVGYQMSKMRIISIAKQTPRAETDAIIIKMFEAGCDDETIAVELGILPNSVRHRRSNLGLTRKGMSSSAKFYLGEMIMGARRKALCEVWK